MRSREAILPGGLNPTPGGSERSDGSLHGGSPRKRGDADVLQLLDFSGGFGGSSVKDRRYSYGGRYVRRLQTRRRGEGQGQRNASRLRALRSWKAVRMVVPEDGLPLEAGAI